MKERLRWGGAILLSVAWSFADGYFTRHRMTAFWMACAAGAICLTLAERRGTSALAAAAFGSSRALAIAGAHLGLQLPLTVVLSQTHRIPSAPEVCRLALAALRLPSAVDPAGNLVLDTFAGPRPFAITWELAALPTMARLAVAVALLGGAPMLARNVTLIAMAAAARVAVVTALLAGGAPVWLEREPAVTLALLLPLVPWLRARHGAVACSGRREVLLPRAARPSSLLGAALLAAAAAAAGWLAGDCGLDAERRAEPARILIDESRSDWEWTGEPFDHARYGQRSVYNYSLWKRWIELHFPTRVLRSPATEADLSRTDVLIVKTPTAPYDTAALERVERFVWDGGGLYLIGDHTNLFGMSTVLNALARPYGIAFRNDDTFPLDPRAADIFRPGRMWRHPLLRGIESYPFETSCSLKVPWNADRVIVGRRLGAEPGDYGQVNFFGNMRLDPSDEFGLFVQAASVTHGRGRVVAFADSTNFSNFSMLWPGRRELTLNVLAWLSRPAAPPGGAARNRAMGWLAALVAGVAGAFLLRGCGAPAAAVAIWLGLGAGALGLRAASTGNLSALPVPEPRAPVSKLVFDTRWSSFHLEEASPILTLGEGPSWEEFNAFFIHAARSGLWPVVAGNDELPAFGVGREALVLIRPVRLPDADGLRALSGYLRAGGRILILDSVLNRRSTTRLIAGALGLETEEVMMRAGEGDGRVRVPAMSGRAAHRRITRGGGLVLWRAIGAGRLMVVFDAAVFSDRAFGGVYTTPGAEQRETYEAQREVLDLLMQPEPEAVAR